jgi:hypothetical protein
MTELDQIHLSSDVEDLLLELSNFRDNLKRTSEDDVRQIQQFLIQDPFTQFNEQKIDEIAQFLLGLRSKYNDMITAVESVIERGD